MQKNQAVLYRHSVDGLSRRQRGFESPWGRQRISEGYTLFV